MSYKAFIPTLDDLVPYDVPYVSQNREQALPPVKVGVVPYVPYVPYKKNIHDTQNISTTPTDAESLQNGSYVSGIGNKGTNHDLPPVNFVPYGDQNREQNREQPLDPGTEPWTIECIPYPSRWLEGQRNEQWATRQSLYEVACQMDDQGITGKDKYRMAIWAGFTCKEAAYIAKLVRTGEWRTGVKGTNTSVLSDDVF